MRIKPFCDCEIYETCPACGEEKDKTLELSKQIKPIKKLYKFYWNCHRMGSVKGLFVSTDEIINKNLGKQVYLGEILGKHSEIFGNLEKEDITEVSADQDFINKFELIVGKSFGHNPLDYISENE